MAEIVRTPQRPRVPEDLVEAVSERRVIPFIGAGFSAAVGLPDWKQLLTRLCTEMDSDLTFEEISSYANDDFLQIAEYLFIKSDRRIGPLRHVIEQGLHSNTVSPVESTAHVELVNLGAPQIYTTNYDDLIESTYRRLSVPFAVVSLPKDVASVANQATQVIKYHGDLRHESTLVLTESAYYKRLDFESPMDLKFRSDLLGRSVLYMGYSFRDINIRLIWFKLMQMMQDIPEQDRRFSYILRIAPNPVLDELYRDVGLQTIVLDPRGRVAEEDRHKLLGDFLGDLANRASSGDRIPGTSDPMFVSPGVVTRAAEGLRDQVQVGSGRMGFSQRMRQFGSQPDPAFRRLLQRRLPSELVETARPVFIQGLDSLWEIKPRDVAGLFSKVRLFGSDENIAFLFARILRGGNNEMHATRNHLIQNEETPWTTVWGTKVGPKVVDYILDAADAETSWNEEGNADDDLVFIADLLKRLQGGQIWEPSDSEEDNTRVTTVASLIGRITAIYPEIEDYEAPAAGAPDLDAILALVSERAAALNEGEIELPTSDWTFEDLQADDLLED